MTYFEQYLQPAVQGLNKAAQLRKVNCHIYGLFGAYDVTPSLLGVHLATVSPLKADQHFLMTGYHLQIIVSE